MFWTVFCIALAHEPVPGQLAALATTELERPLSVREHVRRATLLRRAGQPEAALEALGDAAHPEFGLERARAWLALGAPHEALAAIERVLAVAPSGAAHAVHADALAAVGRGEDARDAALAAVTRAPTPDRVRRAARLCTSIPTSAKVLEDGARSLGTPSLWRAAAAAWHASGNTPRALACQHRALALDRAPVALLELADMTSDSGRAAKARREAVFIAEERARVRPSAQRLADLNAARAALRAASVEVKP